MEITTVRTKPVPAVSLYLLSVTTKPLPAVSCISCYVVPTEEPIFCQSLQNHLLPYLVSFVSPLVTTTKPHTAVSLTFLLIRIFVLEYVSLSTTVQTDSALNLYCSRLYIANSCLMMPTLCINTASPHCQVPRVFWARGWTKHLATVLLVNSVGNFLRSDAKKCFLPTTAGRRQSPARYQS